MGKALLGLIVSLVIAGVIFAGGVIVGLGFGPDDLCASPTTSATPTATRTAHHG